MSKKVEELAADFANRPKWLRDAASRILANDDYSETDIRELAILCKAEAGIIDEGSIPVFEDIPADAFGVAETSHSLRIDSISEVVGVNKLAPRKPLSFEPTPLCIVYGSNGSGKSGYVRLLKQLSGGCKAQQDLLGDVFTEGSIEPSCKINYQIDADQRVAAWRAADGAIKDLHGIAIFDTASAHIYINDENEVSFEPRILRLFTLLVQICDKVSQAIETDIKALENTLPKPTAEIAATAPGKWYTSLTSATTAADIEARCVWGEKEDIALLALQKRVDAESPAEKAAALRRMKGHADLITRDLQALHERLTVEAFASLQAVRASAKEKRNIADADTKKVFQGTLDGINTATWRALWEAARSYSVKEAYKGQSFPQISEKAKCVLCHQTLEQEAGERLEKFEKFITGELVSAATTAEANLAATIKLLDDAPALDSMDKSLDLAGITAESFRAEIKTHLSSLLKRRDPFKSAETLDVLPDLPADLVSTKIAAHAAECGFQAKAFDGDTQSSKAELRNDLAAENAKKWIAQQKALILSEVSRLGKVGSLKEAQKKANTRWLSATKASLSQTMVSQNFIGQFQTELKELGAHHIKVKIEITRPEKGQVYHRINIDGAKHNATPADILSEGQFRIISIAAFLADIESCTTNTPFVFDDPVCSLDDEYERAVAARLTELSRKRQVIVFTHRLSMVAALAEAGKKAGKEPSCIAVRHEEWGAGEPSPSHHAKHNPQKAVNFLLNERLPKAKKLLSELGRDEYENAAKSICSDFREHVEKAVETVLIGNIVQRFTKDIITKGKLGALAKIVPADCALIEELMTAYSFFQHSQSDQAPVKIPGPDKIEADMKRFVDWITEFQGRPVPV